MEQFEETTYMYEFKEPLEQTTDEFRENYDVTDWPESMHLPGFEEMPEGHTTLNFNNEISDATDWPLYGHLPGIAEVLENMGM